MGLYREWQQYREWSKKRNLIASDEHRRLHNENTLFYTLSPSLLVGITKAFQIQVHLHVQDNSTDKLLKGGYYEFGLFKGFSFWFAELVSRDITNSSFLFYGFDSFEGLPASQVDADPVMWQKGYYAAPYEFVTGKLRENGADCSRIRLFKGFFSRELFQDLKKKEQFLPVCICVIDTDIYESCVEVLDFIKEYLVPGSILLFDEYNAFGEDDHHGERRALQEFENTYPTFSKKHLFDFGTLGVAFIVESV